MIAGAVVDEAAHVLVRRTIGAHACRHGSSVHDARRNEQNDGLCKASSHALILAPHFVPFQLIRRRGIDWLAFLAGFSHFRFETLGMRGSMSFYEDRIVPHLIHLSMRQRKRVGGGCHLNRPISDLIVRAGFRIDRLETGYMKGPKPRTFMYEGTAEPVNGA